MSDRRCEFTLRHYREIIEQALTRGFRFLRLRETASALPAGRLIVLRHDIDFSVEDAHRMAALERELGVVATYCVLLHSPTYHVGEPATLERLREIQAMGHEIGLHYDARFFEQFGMSTLEGVTMEAEMLGRLLGARIGSVAQHQPARSGTVRVGGGDFVDAYHDRLTKDMKYLSESRQVWREGCVHRYLDGLEGEGEERLQLLIHPEWWEAGEAATRRAAIARLVSARQAEVAAAMEDYAAGMERGPGQ